MDTVGKIDLKKQLKSLFDTGVNLSVGQIGAIQWAINQLAISKTETTSCEWCEIASACEYEVTFFKDDDRWATERSLLPKFCPNCGRKIKEEQP